MFSPETYALLNGKLAGNTAEIETLKTAVDAKWAKRSITLQAGPQEDMEASFTAASNLSVFSGTSSKNNGMAWYGYKVTASVVAKSLIFRATSGGVEYVGIATRSADGAWTAEAFY